MLKKKINFIVYIFILSAFFITFGCEKSDNNLVNNKLPQPGNNSEINQDDLFNIDGIIDPSNFGWPRTVETSDGIVTIDKKPERIHSLSLGHTEILLGIMDIKKILAGYNFFVDPSISNISELSYNLKEIGFDPEEVIGLNPDVVIASKYTDVDTIAILKDSKIPVIRAELDNSAEGNIPNILFMGYILGAEKEAAVLSEEIKSRLAIINNNKPENNSNRVLSITKWATIFAAGSESTEGGIIEQAGAINAAADSGIDGHKEVSIESIAEINPDIILLPQQKESAEEFKKELLSNPVLFEVPAIKEKKIFHVHPPYFTTLSHWNIRGIEELSKLLYTEEFVSIKFEDFKNWSEIE